MTWSRTVFTVNCNNVNIRVSKTGSRESLFQNWGCRINNVSQSSALLTAVEIDWYERREITCRGGGASGGWETIWRLCLKYWDKLQSFTAEHRERFTQIYVRDWVVFVFHCKITVKNKQLKHVVFCYNWHNTFITHVSNSITASYDCSASHNSHTHKKHSECPRNESKQRAVW
jgi:hypothetical protein